jgi:tight adherence protein B
MILIFLAIALVSMAPYFFKKWQAEKARQRLAAQFRAALQNMVHALRVGVGFQQALDYAAREGEAPLCDEWKHVMQAIRLGQPLSEALDLFHARVTLHEVQWFVAAVHITQSTGGSLADVLDTLATTLQERQTLREKVSALTAQGKASGVLLTILPYALMGALAVVAPEFARSLFKTTAGQAVIAGVTVSVIIGGLVIKKIVTIEVN